MKKDIHPSYHEINVVMTDGSVKWVDNSIELLIWRAYGSRAGQELIPPAKQL